MIISKFESIVKKVKSAALVGAMVMVVSVASAQSTDAVHSNPNVRLGEKALLDGDFKSAASYLQKAMPAEAKDPNVLYLLGYSQYHSGEYKKASESFTKVLALEPENVNAFYYRGKVNSTLAVATDAKTSESAREKLLNSAIDDYSKAIDFNAEDVKLFQNRAIAYRDLAILVGTSGTQNYNKSTATQAYNKSISDFEQVLKLTPGKKDIETEIKKAKVYRDNLK